MFRKIGIDGQESVLYILYLFKTFFSAADFYRIFLVDDKVSFIRGIDLVAFRQVRSKKAFSCTDPSLSAHLSR